MYSLSRQMSVPNFSTLDLIKPEIPQLELGHPAHSVQCRVMRGKWS